jgi:hypothetical protein
VDCFETQGTGRQMHSEECTVYWKCLELKVYEIQGIIQAGAEMAIGSKKTPAISGIVGV